MNPFLNTAITAARRAGTIIVRAMEQDNMQIDNKGPNDFVTEIDRQAEDSILDILHKAYPEHGFMAEESGFTGNRHSDYEWIIDPIDGTTNFIHRFPQFAVSIALKYRGTLEQGVIYDPLRDELFTASRGAGARLNNRRIRVTSCRTLPEALLGTGFPFRDTTYLDTYLNVFRELMPQAAGIRRPGAASLDLAYVAAGRLDGFFEFALKPWDIAAGVLLVQEAGGLVGDVRGGMNHIQSGHIVAANPKLFKLLIQSLHRSLPADFKA